MSKDGTDLKDCARDYALACESIGLERRNIRDLQDAKLHPSFKAEHHALLDRLAKEYRMSLLLIERPARWTVKIGTHKEKQDLRNAVESEGHKFTYWAGRIVDSKDWTVETEERELPLFEGTVKEVTGNDVATTDEIMTVLDRLGFAKCPDETALQLRRVYTDSPVDEWRAVISEPRADSGGFAVLYVGRDPNGSWVDCNYASPGIKWDGDVRLVFCHK